jgi:hypothetical protein
MAIKEQVAKTTVAKFEANPSAKEAQSLLKLASIFSKKSRADFGQQLSRAETIYKAGAEKVASKSIDKRTLYFVEALQKKGLTIKQFMDLGATVTNLSNSHIFYKPENDTDELRDGQALRVEAGNMLFTSFDGLATELHNDQVYKVSDLNKFGSLGLVILPGGNPAIGVVSSVEEVLFPITRLVPFISWFGLDGTGWKDRAWQASKNAQNWNALFDAASTF